MKTVTGVFTRADYAALPEGFPVQLVEGFLVKDPAPTYGHQRFSSRIHAALARLVGADRVLSAPVDVPIDEHNVFQPDIAVFEEQPPDDVGGVLVPLLAVEVLSSATRLRDRAVKCPRYLEAGVAEVWLVDPKTRTIEVHTRRAVHSARGTDAARSEVLPGFELIPSDLFAPNR